MRIVFFGTPKFAVSSLEALVSSKEQVELVITQPDRKKGRGHILAHPAVKEFALSTGLEFMQPVNIRDAGFVNAIASIKPELIVVVAYGRIIPSDILKIPRFGCINVHASLLPKYRGAAPIQWAIINGEKTTGITTMLMDEGLDTGDILMQDEIKITQDDTSESLSAKLSELGAALLLKTIQGIKQNTVKPLKQAGEITYAPMITKEQGCVDWSKTAAEIDCFVRGMHPWPGAYCYLNNERIKLIEAHTVEGSGDPGRIETIESDALIIGTSKGLLKIARLQPEGKKPMPTKAFLSGRNIMKGMYVNMP